MLLTKQPLLTAMLQGDSEREVFWTAANRLL